MKYGFNFRLHKMIIGVFNYLIYDKITNIPANPTPHHISESVEKT